MSRTSRAAPAWRGRSSPASARSRATTTDQPARSAGQARKAPSSSCPRARGQVRSPYPWGGESPDRGFDCSGLVQYSYARAGLALPRTAQTQYDAGPLLAQGATPRAGDLVFFGVSTHRITHVAIALG